MSLAFSKKQKQLLVSGYLRSNTNFTIANILKQTQISTQCYLFYEQAIEYVLREEALTALFNVNNSESVVAPSIKYHDIEFEYAIFPNGKHRDEHGFIAIDLSLVSKPKDIDQINVFCRICLENRVIFKRSIQFDAHHCLHSFADSSLCNLKLSEYEHVNALTFSVQIDIFNIHYHQDTNDERLDVLKWSEYHSKYFEKIRIAQHSQYEWKLNEVILRQLCGSNNKLFYFEDCLHECAKQKHFDSNSIWTMTVSSNFGDPLISLHLMKLPFNIKKIDIRCKLTIKYDGNNDEQYITIMDVLNVGLSDKYTDRINYHHSKRWLAMIHSVNELSINWEICVLRVFDFNGSVLFRDEREQHPFICELMNC